MIVCDFSNPSYTYMTMEDTARADVHRHLRRAKRAFSEANEFVAFDRMRKAKNARKIERFWSRKPFNVAANALIKAFDDAIALDLGSRGGR